MDDEAIFVKQPAWSEYVGNNGGQRYTACRTRLRDGELEIEVEAVQTHCELVREKGESGCLSGP